MVKCYKYFMLFGVYCNKLFLSHMPCSPTILNGSLSSVQMFTKIKGVLLNIFSSKFNGQTDCNVTFLLNADMAMPLLTKASCRE